MKDRRPSLDWPAVRQIHDPTQAPWPQVRPLLVVLEEGARKAVSKQQGNDE